MLGRGLLVVKIIADQIAGENLRCHHLRMRISLPITQEKRVPAVGFRPELGTWNRDGRARSSGRAAEGERINAFCSDHARVWRLP